MVEEVQGTALTMPYGVTALGEQYQQHVVLTRVSLTGSLGVPWPLADQPCQSPTSHYPLPRCSAPPCRRWPGTMSPRRSTAAPQRSRCMPAAAAQRGDGRLRRRCARYNALANVVRRTLHMDMPDIDLSSLREVPWAPRRTVTPPAPSYKAWSTRHTRTWTSHHA